MQAQDCFSCFQVSQVPPLNTRARLSRAPSPLIEIVPPRNGRGRHSVLLGRARHDADDVDSSGVSGLVWCYDHSSAGLLSGSATAAWFEVLPAKAAMYSAQQIRSHESVWSAPGVSSQGFLTSMGPVRTQSPKQAFLHPDHAHALAQSWGPAPGLFFFAPRALGKAFAQLGAAGGRFAF